MAVLRRHFGIFDILEDSLLSEHFQGSICSRVFSPVVDCRLQCCNVIKKETPLQMLFWVFSKVFGAGISKHRHENIYAGV